MTNSIRAEHHEAAHTGVARRFHSNRPNGILIRVGSRRWFLQTGLAGAGWTLPELLRFRAQGSSPHPRGKDGKAVILIWLSGGPSHLDTFDPKPDAPIEVRGPFRPIATKVPGVRICEYLPLQAEHHGPPGADPVRRLPCQHRSFPRPDAGRQPRPASKINPTSAPIRRWAAVACPFPRAERPGHAGLRRPGRPETPFRRRSWVLGRSAAPTRRSTRPTGGPADSTEPSTSVGPKTAALCRAVRPPAARPGPRRRHMAQMDHYRRQALEMVLSGKAGQAFRVEAEPDRVPRCLRPAQPGRESLAGRRLVEAGVTFVTVSGTFGMFDNHGDDHFAGGLVKGTEAAPGCAWIRRSTHW